jgi:hypothetical protein
MDTDKTTESIIHRAIQVSNTLGVGFLEKVGLILNFGISKVGIKRMVL